MTGFYSQFCSGKNPPLTSRYGNKIHGDMENNHNNDTRGGFYPLSSHMPDYQAIECLQQNGCRASGLNRGQIKKQGL